jgi:hypothetical protein
MGRLGRQVVGVFEAAAEAALGPFDGWGGGGDEMVLDRARRTTRPAAGEDEKGVLPGGSSVGCLLHANLC